MKWRWWIIGLLVVGGVTKAVQDNFSHEISDAVTRVEAWLHAAQPKKLPPLKADPNNFSQEVVETIVRAQLRDPQSAMFSDWSATNDRKIKGMSAGLVVCGSVNAKNGFGGYTGRKMFIHFYGTRLVDIEPTPRTDSFATSWNKLCAG